LEQVKNFIKENGLLLLLGVLLAATMLLPDKVTLQSASTTLQKHIAKEKKYFLQLTEDTALVARIHHNKSKGNDLEMIAGTGMNLLCYERDSLIFWSDNDAIPNESFTGLTDTVSVRRLRNGWYLVFSRSNETRDITWVGLVPLQYSYPIENRFLQNKIALVHDFPSRFKFSADEIKGGVAVNDIAGHNLFYIWEDESVTESDVAWLRLAAQLLLLLIICVYISQLVQWLRRKRGFAAALFFLVIITLTARGIMIWLHIPGELNKLPLFSPELFASGRFIASLGDLLLSSCMALWWVLFFFRHGTFTYPIAQPKWLRVVHQVLIVGVLFGLGILIAYIFEILVLDSTISFQVYNLLSLGTYSFLGLLCIACIYLVHYLIADMVVEIINGISLKMLWVGVSISVWLVLLVTLLLVAGFSSIYLIATLWSAIFVIVLIWIREGRFTLSRSRNLIIVIALYSGLSTYLIETLYEVRERNLRQFSASNLLSERDHNVEYAFDGIGSKIKSDKFIRSAFSTPAISRRDVRDRLNTLYLNNYFSRYESQFSLFSEDGFPVSVQDSTSLSDYIVLWQQDSNSTTMLRYVQDSIGDFTYLAIMPFSSDSNMLGYLVLRLIPKTYFSNNVYPELLTTSGIGDKIDEEGLGYAIYHNNRLVAQQGDFPYSYYWNNDYRFNGAQDAFIDVEGWEHNIHQYSDDKRVIITVKQESEFEPVATFSYFFTIFLIVGGLLLAGIGLNRKRLKKEAVPGSLYISFRTRINYSMLAIIIVSFFVIGIITISFFRDKYDNFYTDRLMRKEKAIHASLEYTVGSSGMLKYNNKPSLEELDQELAVEISKLATINAIDVNLYDVHGNLVSSSQNMLYDKGIVSRKMNAMAFLNILRGNESQYTHDEHIGKLDYLAIYSPLRNKRGETVAFIGIPYFERTRSIDDEVSTFLVALMNVYVFLLICTAIVAFFISNSVTKPLTYIAERLQLINLNKKNEPIEWDSNDEIGVLVKQYNKMIRELENSAEQLARTEREGAWREMAKQIAHEIKNPLTPMKLSIQYLQRAIDDNNPNIEALARKVSRTLVEQIDNLSAIATSFSSFAQMPKGVYEEVDLSEVLPGIAELFNKEYEDGVQLEIKVNPAKVFADRNQLISVFNNLVKNGLQSVPDDRNAHVNILIEEEHAMIKVHVKDNGCGIPEENYNKVFVPNFTTKSSGTGLGLAISIQIVETAGGAIWFESKVNEGTTFFIVLPKIK
jgi:two-component system nitrogen regulation sensor histidine kinase NtrY